jgi:hypothetical protein
MQLILVGLLFELVLLSKTITPVNPQVRSCLKKVYKSRRSVFDMRSSVVNLVREWPSEIRCSLTETRVNFTLSYIVLSYVFTL